MKRYNFTSFEAYETAELPFEETGVLIREKGWWKADLCTCTKSREVALNRFFRLFPAVASWREFMDEMGKYHDNECGVHFEIDMNNADNEYGGIYIFLNLNEKARGSLD